MIPNGIAYLSKNSESHVNLVERGKALVTSGNM